MFAACRVGSALLLVMLGGVAGCSGPDAEEPSTSTSVSQLEPSKQQAHILPADGYLARSWSEQTRQFFIQLDRNRDGRLDFMEIRAGFAVFDVDGDGFISAFEARSLVAIGDRDRDGKLSRFELELLPEFALGADHDEDGVISAVEFALVRIREFVRADRDRDGQLAAEEVAALPDFTLFPF